MSVIGGGMRLSQAVKLGQGGIEYVARVVGCDPKTVRLGNSELKDEPPKNQQNNCGNLYSGCSLRQPAGVRTPAVGWTPMSGRLKQTGRRRPVYGKSSPAARLTAASGKAWEGVNAATGHDLSLAACHETCHLRLREVGTDSATDSSLSD